MAKRSKSKKLVKSVDLDLDDASALEGVIVPNLSKVFESVLITNAQLSNFADTVAGLASAYGSFAIGLQGAMQEFAKSQQRIAEAIAAISRNAALNQMEIVIRSFRIPEFPTLNFPVPKLQPVQVFVQPAPAYIPPKALPLPRRKQKLPLTTVAMKEDGFVHNGEYIRGVTKGSQVGMLFELFIDQKLAGVIPDSLIYEMLHINSGDYRARDYVIRDLKDILMGNKLELIMDRYRGLKQYTILGITKRIRKSKKKKKLANPSKSN